MFTILGADLIVAKDKHEDQNKFWPHWSIVNASLELPHPWYKSMNNVLGFSKTMLNEVHKYVIENQRLEFCEVIFNTLAHYMNLTILNPSVLSNMSDNHIWLCHDVSKSPLNWFHPIKKQIEFVGACVTQGYWNRDWFD